jgi:hypothetical protein
MAIQQLKYNGMRQFGLAIVALFLTAGIFSACGGKDSVSPQSRLVKYEVTGNYSGQLTVAYTNASGSLEDIIVTAIPWSKEFTMAAGVGGGGFGGNSVISKPGAPGQTTVSKIYIGGKEVKSANAIADANGNIPSIGALSFAF